MTKMSCRDGVCQLGSTDGGDDSSKPRLLADGGDVSTGNGAETPKDDDGRVPVEIDVISDTMCPWCWVGKRNMELALRDCSSQVKATKVTFLPFFLDADLPEEGKPVRDYYRDNYGDPFAGDGMQPHLVRAGRKAGLDFETNFGKMTHYRPTLMSHRLIELAKTQGRQDEVVEEIFKMYFEGGGHLNSVDDLTAAAERAGLTGGTREFLEGDDFAAAVRDEAEDVRRITRGVPTFVFRRADRPKGKNGGGGVRELTFSGGRPPSAFKEVFRQLSEMD